MGFEFCPDLQANWHLEGINMVELGEVRVIVTELATEDPSSPIGRHGSDVLSYPTIYTESSRTEFIFRGCTSVNIRDHVAPGHAENDAGEGKTFQRLLASELVNLHAARAIDKVIHYRLVCSSEVIDVVCYEAPVIIRQADSRRC